MVKAGFDFPKNLLKNSVVTRYRYSDTALRGAALCTEIKLTPLSCGATQYFVECDS